MSGAAEEFAEDFEMSDLEEELEIQEGYRAARRLFLSDSEEDDDEYDGVPGLRVTDTTPEQLRNGKDIQGIPWDHMSITRDSYRKTRLDQYKNYENINDSGEASKKGCTPTEKGGLFYDFRRNTRSVESTILHFQLRNLVWATSKHDLYLMSRFSVIHWSALTREKHEVLNLGGHVAPREKHPGNLLEGFSQTQVSTLVVRDNFLIAGGFQGELICKNLDREGVSFCCRTVHEENAITNAVEIYDSPSGAVHFMASNNDGGVRNFDMKQFQLTKQFRFEWPVNHTSLSPDGKLLVVVGDDTEGLLVDSDTGKIVKGLAGHKDYSFASAWHPDGRTFATGNQDKTCRLWDIRNLSKAVAVFRGHLGAVRSIRFSSDGRFMAMAEPADFVHIFDVDSGYKKRQEIDFFGEIAGMSFSPDTEALFVGVWDRTYGSLLQYSRNRNFSYLDSLL